MHQASLAPMRDHYAEMQVVVQPHDLPNPTPAVPVPNSGRHPHTDLGYHSPAATSRMSTDWFGQYGQHQQSMPQHHHPHHHQQQQQQQPQQTPVQIGYGEAMIDPNFELQSRARSNTWPLRPPSSKMEPVVPKPEPIVELQTENEQAQLQQHQMMSCVTESPHRGYPSPMEDDLPGVGSLGLGKLCPSPPSACSLDPHLGQSAKKSGSRRNAWGNLSYADLITKAIQTSPDQRLTLSQVYEWMVHNVPYFKDKGDSNSSAGWKVSDYVIGAISTIPLSQNLVIYTQYT